MAETRWTAFAGRLLSRQNGFEHLTDKLHERGTIAIDRSRGLHQSELAASVCSSDISQGVSKRFFVKFYNCCIIACLNPAVRFMKHAVRFMKHAVSFVFDE